MSKAHRVSQTTRNWLVQGRNRSDADRGSFTAGKLVLWLTAWDLLTSTWITTAELRAALAIHERQLRRLLHRFEAAGLVEWKRGRLGRGRAGFIEGRVRRKGRL